ncbi:putative lysine transport system substrate-binding protein [Bacilli bacterium PM5-3]|nr:putative lysine transport system substrate-binding protein [Bacilli bacterium PM5-3]
MRRFTVMIICALFLFGCANNGASSTSGLDDGVLTIGLECDYSPYNWTTTSKLKGKDAMEISGSQGYCEGYDISIAKLVARELDVEVEVKKMTWDGLIPALNNGQIDLIVAGMSPTSERKESINFTDSYYEDNPKEVIVVRKDSKYVNATKLSDFNQASITAQQGTLQASLISQIDGVQSSALLPDYVSLIQSVKAKTIDGYISEYAVASEHVNANKDLVLVEFNENDGFVLSKEDTTIAMGVNKKDEKLLKEVNKALKSISNDAREKIMNEIIERADNND